MNLLCQKLLDRPSCLYHHSPTGTGIDHLTPGLFSAVNKGVVSRRAQFIRSPRGGEIEKKRTAADMRGTPYLNMI